MESYNCFSNNNNMSFVDDDSFSNFSLRGKKYHARKRAVAAANTRTNELNTLISSPDVILTVPIPVNPPPVPVNPATLLDIGEVNPNVPVRPNPTLPLVPTDAKVTSTTTTPTSAEENPIVSSTTDISSPKYKKFIVPYVLGAALLVGLLVFLKKKK